MRPCYNKSSLQNCFLSDAICKVILLYSVLSLWGKCRPLSVRTEYPFFRQNGPPVLPRFPNLFWELIALPNTGLITFHFAHHYGAQLQAYALMAAVEKLGSPCRIIDYRLPHTVRTNRLFRSGKSPVALAANAHTLLHYPAMKARFDRFEAFVAENMRLTGRRYFTNEELAEYPPEFGLYLAGSDQIWNPRIFQSGRFDPAFFLSFAGEGRRAAYAPSFGVPSLTETEAAELREYLSRFSALSVREKQGREIVRFAAGRDARVVLDPTLLLTGEDWAKLAVPPKDTRPYLLCYFISDYSVLIPYAERLAAERGLRLVHLAGVRRAMKGAQVVFDAGPREFLGLFQRAAFVLTNSFHGTVFSLQFQKPFFTAVSPKEQSRPDLSRIFNLLDTLGVSDRIIGTDREAELTAPVDYGAVTTRLERARKASLDFLRSALSGGDGNAAADGLSSETAAEPAFPKGEPAAGALSASPDSSADNTNIFISREIRLCAPADCTGCGACFQVCPHGAIEMKPDREGFLRPVITEKCVRCGLCVRTCPILQNRPGRPQGKVYAARNRDAAVLGNSTSGGFFSVLAEDVLSRGGAVFGAAFDETFRLRHVKAETPAELLPLRYAKYVQSDTGESFREVRRLLTGGRPVLFSGTPCQVDGLYSFLGKDDPNLLTCDLVCHGVPSPGVFADYVRLLETRQGAKLVSVLFRDKAGGWTPARFTARFADGNVFSRPLVGTEYGRGFGMALFLRPCCHRCRYTEPTRRGDFTLGDFWGIDPAALPGEIKSGVSLVLLNSEKACERFAALGGGFESVPRTMEEAVRGNPRLASPHPAAPGRAAFFSAWRLLPFSATARRFLRPPSLPYRAATRLLTPDIKEKLRGLLR